MVQLTGKAAVEISRRIAAKRTAWRQALGVPQGFAIPDKPIPATRAEIEAELAIVTNLALAAMRAKERLPPGPEHEAQALAMVKHRDRRVQLILELREASMNRR
jgi:hypothetical protein